MDATLTVCTMDGDLYTQKSKRNTYNWWDLSPISGKPGRKGCTYLNAMPTQTFGTCSVGPPVSHSYQHGNSRCGTESTLQYRFSIANTSWLTAGYKACSVHTGSFCPFLFRSCQVNVIVHQSIVYNLIKLYREKSQNARDTKDTGP